MKLVIDISESIIEHLKDGSFGARIEDRATLVNAVMNGIPLPKGHGRIGDLDKVADRLEELMDNWNYYGNEYENGVYTGYEYSLDEVMDAPTIIEAEREDKK